MTGRRQITLEMERFFYERTDRHIMAVQDYLDKIAILYPKFEDDLWKRSSVHDEDKKHDPNLIPYIWLTWKKKCATDGTDPRIPGGMNARILEATNRHCVDNPHHPEYHHAMLTGETGGLINSNDRDKPVDGKLVDATGMTTVDIMEMVADWCAVADEMGNSAMDWAEKNVNVRWKFDGEQESLIYRLIRELSGDGGVKC